CSSYTDINVLF
nr:immunoglobulin light chain junction region [Macaca mulatta]MPO04370.1 immunoglobulin light chain junction region [Macaca mulatta]MPO05050.1 immunoglobulin light chain junction region [Macaca mulatta]MPO05212.1 immunoglobulin light chain junction region [Macaca mulatta]MPO06409.1 immunoglobulin light chain junction region [Macaca mulatta]